MGPQNLDYNITFLTGRKPPESIKFLSNSQLTVNGAIGRAGQHVVSRVVVEHRVDPELVPIPRHNMEAKAAVEKTNKSVHATRPHVQVINVRFILAYMLNSGFVFQMEQL